MPMALYTPWMMAGPGSEDELMVAAFCQQCGEGTTERPIEGRPRPVCGSCGAVTYLDPKLAVAVVIQRGRELLLGRRGPRSREAGKWSFPAGFVERGKAVEDAAVREVREEVGLEVEIGPLIGLYSRQGETVVLAVYAAAAARGEPVAADDLDAAGWFPVAALPPLAFPHDTRIIADWRRWRDATP